MTQSATPSDIPRRAVILTAIRSEYKAVRQHLRNLDEHRHPRGSVYDWGYFDAYDGLTWHVHLAEVGQGNEGAALEAERIIGYVNPAIALFVGVAGGLKDVVLGDVVAATDIFNYESGKDTSTGFLPRPNAGASTYDMIQRARAVGRHENWKSRCKSAHMQKARAFVEPIVAGEKVLASRRTALYRFLKTNYSHALAVEMEGRGFLRATAANPQVSALVVRGISDLLHKKGATDRRGWQEKAVCAAAAFAMECLASYEAPPKTTSVPESAVTTPPRRVIAICGNPKSPRSDEMVFEIARLLAAKPMHVVHGPRGAGITAVNMVHNKFQRRDITSEVMYVERERIIAPAEFVVVIDGGPMTSVEADLGIQMKKKVLPIPGTGGAAEKCYQRMRMDPRTYDFWLDPLLFDALARTTSAVEDAAILERAIFAHA